MSTIQDNTAAVARNTAAVDAAVAALAAGSTGGTVLSAADQTELDAAVVQLDANSAALAAATPAG